MIVQVRGMCVKKLFGHLYTSNFANLQQIVCFRFT